MKISELKHPTYSSMVASWRKWRLTYEGGDSFINAYLKKFSNKESNTDFRIRKSLTYSPSFAKASIIDIKNAIFQRASDTVRAGGSNTYSKAMVGELGGVDLQGSTMDAFVGQELLGELLTMSRVGVYVDMPEEIGDTQASALNKHPYVYAYKAEDILNWNYDKNFEFTSLLLRAHVNIMDSEFELPIKETTEYRYFVKTEDGVSVSIYGLDGSKTVTDLNITSIPFVILEISNSLLADVSNYQIAHLNLASSDVFYAWKSNYPFYVEQYDPKLSLQRHLKQSTDGTEAVAGVKESIDVGIKSGRKYPKDLDKPSFISPSAEPLKVSMEKQNKMKEEVRELVNLSLSGIKAKMVSSESRKIENEGLEAGLANIGLVLETAERKIAEYWHMYENTTDDTIVRYPEHYQLKTDEVRNTEAKTLKDFMATVPSVTYKKELSKAIADLTIGHKIGLDVAKKIDSEIDSAEVVIANPQVILDSHEGGLVTGETASTLLGFKSGEFEDAKIEQAERLARIQAAQSPNDGAARGIKDLAVDPNASKLEK